MPSLAGRCLRFLLLVPLLLGARLDCGAAAAEEAAAEARQAQRSEADCHHAEDPAAPDAPRHSHGELPVGHCPLYHSCALDFSLALRVRQARGPALSLVPAERRSAELRSRTQLPEVPPPRS
ncbi:MAG TPA: hypothetical protein VL241_07405 [Gemmatimonadales bacterium]|nr:hypothetical protein [Gemmatimonadales bacterium]